MKNLLCLSLAFVAATLLGAVGDTEVMKWENGAKACFLLMFDDGWPSGLDVAMPELAKRSLSATYYIVPEKGEYKAREKDWKRHANDKGVAYGNHTMHHNEVRDYEHAKNEIGGVCGYIRTIVTNPSPKLVSWALPGLKPGHWKLSAEDLDRIMNEYHMVSRPDFRGHGAVYHLKTTEDMTKLADKAIADGGMEYVIFHGLEHKAPWRTWQDFWAMKQDICFPFFDRLAELQKNGDLWVTDHISYHSYETERKTAKVTRVKSNGNSIGLKLASDADPAYYDYPLTLETSVPSSWKKAKVKQGAKSEVVPVVNGKVRYRAVPGKDLIVLQRV